jgi:hypothetical protein
MKPEYANLANDCSTMYTTDEDLFGAKTESYGMKLTECLCFREPQPIAHGTRGTELVGGKESVKLFCCHDPPSVIDTFITSLRTTHTFM